MISDAVPSAYYFVDWINGKGDIFPHQELFDHVKSLVTSVTGSSQHLAILFFSLDLIGQTSTLHLCDSRTLWSGGLSGFHDGNYDSEKLRKVNYCCLMSFACLIVLLIHCPPLFGSFVFLLS